jgi:Tol biopolymer transport system component
LFGAYSRQQIYTINADKTNLKTLTNNPKNEVYNVKLFWSPNNSRIAYYYNKPGGLAGEQQDIYLLGINRGTAKNLTQKPRNYDELSWSPDCQLIAFVAGTSTIKKYTQSMLTVTSSIN